MPQHYQRLLQLLPSLMLVVLAWIGETQGWRYRRLQGAGGGGAGRGGGGGGGGGGGQSVHYHLNRGQSVHYHLNRGQSLHYHYTNNDNVYIHDDHHDSQHDQVLAAVTDTGWWIYLVAAMGGFFLVFCIVFACKAYQMPRRGSRNDENGQQQQQQRRRKGFGGSVPSHGAWVMQGNGSLPSHTSIPPYSSPQEEEEEDEPEQGLFATGTYYGSYYQYNKRYAIPPLTLDFSPFSPPATSTDEEAGGVRGEGNDSVGRYRISGLCHGNRLALSKTYIPGTGDPRENKGHTVELRLRYGKLDRISLQFDMGITSRPTRMNATGEAKEKDATTNISLPPSYWPVQQYGFIGTFHVRTADFSDDGFMVLYPQPEKPPVAMGIALPDHPSTGLPSSSI